MKRFETKNRLEKKKRDIQKFAYGENFRHVQFLFYFFGGGGGSFMSICPVYFDLTAQPVSSQLNSKTHASFLARHLHSKQGDLTAISAGDRMRACRMSDNDTIPRTTLSPSTNTKRCTSALTMRSMMVSSVS